MPGLDWAALDAVKLVRDPYDHFVLDQALLAERHDALVADYPVIRSPGSFSLNDAPPGPALADLIGDLTSERFRRRMEEVFDIDLAGRPTTVTLRGQASQKDGRIHTDSKSKILTLLLYLNPAWDRTDGGQLRLLRGEHDLEDYAVEVPATMGTMLVFRRTENSWHGHSTFVGQRRVLQLNYVRSEQVSLVGALRHRLSALTKSRVA